MGKAPKPVSKLAPPEAIAVEIDRLAGLPLAGLRAAWHREFRRPPPKGLWRDLLLRTLAWQLQEKAFGGHDKATERLLATYGKQENRPAGQGRLNRRLKTGTVLVRDFGGVRHTVTLAPEGFIWQEKTYYSLSAIAKLITGTNWNGPRFFGLRERRGVASADRTRAA
jgi:hypothetical protein